MFLSVSSIKKLNEQCGKQKDNSNRSNSPSEEITPTSDLLNSSFNLEMIEDGFMKDILETIGSDLEISDSRDDTFQLENNLANVSNSTFEIPEFTDSTTSLSKYEIN